jgi:hypothetical protein
MSKGKRNARCYYPRMTDRNLFTIPATILAVALLVSTAIAAESLYATKSSENSISVTGSAQKIITSDVAKWHISLSRDVGLDALKDGNTQIGGDLAALKSYLKKGGMDGSGITISAVTVTTQYNYQNGQTPSGYQLSQDVTVESNDVNKITTLAQKSSSLLGQGALVSTTSLEYYYSKLADLKVDMLAAATADAQARAKKIAESAGSHLGKLRSASMGVLQITPVNSTDVSDYGTYDTTSIQKQITAVVRGEFGVN